MKKLSLSLAAIASLAAASAQTDSAVGLKRLPTQKGSVMLGANLLAASLAIGSNDNDGFDAYYNIGVSPRAGYFVADNLAIGATFNGHFDGSGSYNSQSYGGGVFARYYLGKATDKQGDMKKFRFFAEGGANYFTGVAHMKDGQGNKDRQTFNGSSVYIMPGFNYFLTKNVALEGGLYYMRSLHTNNAIANPNQIGINLGLQFFFGRKGK